MYTLEKLRELGFQKEELEGLGILNYVNKISENVRLVLDTVFKEIFIWIISEDAQDEDMDGTKIILDTDNLEQAISLCKMIVGVDKGW